MHTLVDPAQAQRAQGAPLRLRTIDGTAHLRNGYYLLVHMLQKKSCLPSVHFLQTNGTRFGYLLGGTQ